MADTPLEPDEYVVFHHHDALGNTIVTTGANGEVLWFEQTEPYGKTLGKRNVRGSGLTVDPFHEEEGRSRPGYTGHVRDGATGLTYMQARHYSPELGRFLSNDPIGVSLSSPQSFNRYAYANNNPYRYVDPDGRLPVPLIIAGIGAAVTAYETYQTYQSEGAAAAGKSAAIGAALTASGAGGAKLAGSLGKRTGNFLERMTSRLDVAVDGRDGLNPGDVVARRTTRAGDPAVRITREDGSVIDISSARVKEYVSNTHPNAPPGALDQVKFDNALPGSKGKKREPTVAERNLLDEDGD